MLGPPQISAQLVFAAYPIVQLIYIELLTMKVILVFYSYCCGGCLLFSLSLKELFG